MQEHIRSSFSIQLDGEVPSTQGTWCTLARQVTFRRIQRCWRLPELRPAITLITTFDASFREPALDAEIHTRGGSVGGGEFGARDEGVGEHPGGGILGARCGSEDGPPGWQLGCAWGRGTLEDFDEVC